MLIALMGCMLLLGILQVFSRFVIQRPIPWSEALLTYMFIWTSFIGASVAVDIKSHFVVEIVMDRMPPVWRRAGEIFSFLAIGIFSAFLFARGVFLVSLNKDQLMSSMPFSMVWPYLILPLTGILMIVHSLNTIAGIVTGGGKEP